MSECSVLELSKRLSSEGAILIDVREPVEFAGSRIAGANLIPLGEIESRNGEIDREKNVYLVCRSGRRSGEAQRKLFALGFANVINVSGGIDAWKRSGLAVERDGLAQWSIERQVRFTAGLLVLIGVLLSVFVHPYFIALSGLVGFGLAFTATIDWCGMGMLIAKMPWNKRAI